MTVAYPLDETRSVFIEKIQTVYDLSLETDRHPRQTFTLLATIGSSNGSLSNKRKRAGA
jgi:hypothetical protein